MISFIVPAHDEEALLGATLDALQATARALSEPCEVIVVDDASTDRTAIIAQDHAAHVVNVSCRHIAATRNAGARAASGELLIFVDADTLIDARVVKAALNALREGAVGGGAAVHLQDPLSRVERMAQAFFAWLFRFTRIAPGCILFCTRAAFDTAGGFDESFYAGEDVALSRTLARQGRFVILRQAVITSARKLRTFSGTEQWKLVLRFAWRGRRMLRSRSDLDLWYGKRR